MPVLKPWGSCSTDMTPADSQPDILVQKAIQAGASRAAVISTEAICAEKHLAELCSSPKCRNYGLSKSCPPHVSGPEGLIEYLKGKNHAIVVRIDLSTDVLFSDQRRDIMHLLHDIVSRVETAAVEMGFTGARGFAGSSCKEIFCRDHEHCQALLPEGKCRHPETARPSMSGFGIDVSKLMSAAGWSSKITPRQSDGTETSSSWVAGLVVLG